MDEVRQYADRISPVKQALLKVREMRTKLEAMENRQREPIAIVGVGLRFPGGCVDLEGFWQLMADGVDAIGEVPPERWDINAYYDADPDKPGKMYCRHGGFIDRIDEFDPAFFGISPREAQTMDPQQRLMLEVGWEALENAGQAPDRLSGSLTGIYLAINNSDYFRYLLASPDSIDAYSTIGSAASVTAARLAYLLNLKGPAMAIDTACSSSLVATHLAVRSLRAGECDLALVGGVNLMLLPEITINFCKSRMLAADGRCKVFDASADGYVRGEGCAMIVLKRFSDAFRNRDKVLALIRGSAVNQDGRSNGITAPNGPAQVEVIRQALADANLSAGAVGFVETHGTATALGDPIEAQALGEVYGSGRKPDQPLAIGSVKSNIGHLEAAAGLAGLIKAALALQKEVIPPSLHLKQVNPHISLNDLNLTIPTTTTPWASGRGSRVAGVSSFGLSGTNAHIILEKAAETTRSEEARSADQTRQILTLSGRDESALRASASRCESHLTSSTDPFGDICYTANAGRMHFGHRLALLACSATEAADQLASWRASDPDAHILHEQVDENGAPDIVFLYSGQGSQYPDMGRGLFETQPVFRDAMQVCDEVLRPYLDLSLLDIVYGDKSLAGRLDQTRYTQPALFALEYALTQLWHSWGIAPAAVMGHSLGEYAAACAAGVFSLEDGLRLVARRAALIATLPERGKMAVVFANDKAVSGVLDRYPGICMAAINGPANTVISGNAAELDSVVTELTRQGLHTKALNVSHAFHSALMDPILDELEQAVAEIDLSPPGVALISNRFGKTAEPSEITKPAYWRLHLREPVQFVHSIGELIRQGYRIFVEIGPQPVLLGMAEMLAEDEDVTCLPSLRKGENDHDRMLASLAGLHVRGAAVDWHRFYDGATYRRVQLPTYSFQRARFWTERPATQPMAGAAEPSAAWDYIVACTARQADHVPFDLSVAGYAEKWQRLEGLTCAYIEGALASMGLFNRAEEHQTAAGIVDSGLVLPNYRKLLQRWLQRLSRAGILQATGEGFRAVRPLDDSRLRESLEAASAAFKGQSLFFDYIQRCGRLAPDILAGRQDPLETLFPDGSSDVAEWLYGQWPVSRYISAIAAAAAVAATTVSDASGMLRIIEVGAGTGGTTQAVLEALPPNRVEYWFTDISEFFFTRAREKFANHPMLRFGVLDIEKDPEPQGAAPASFDVVIATNVLHATTDLDAAMVYTRSLLAPGGILILSEVTEDFAWHDITTGLIEGWQRFEDKRRKDSPLLDTGQWQELLRNRGFQEVTCFPQQQAPTAILGQHVILARAPYGERTQVGDGGRTPQKAALSVSLPVESSQPKQPMEPPDKDAMTAILSAPPDERHERLVTFIRSQLAIVLRLDAGHRPSAKARLMDLGLDSLMAVELRNRLTQALGVDRKLPATLVFDYPTVDAIAKYLDREFLADARPPAEERAAEADNAQRRSEAAEKVAALSDTEVERMLMERLRRKQEVGE